MCTVPGGLLNFCGGHSNYGAGIYQNTIFKCNVPDAFSDISLLFVHSNCSKSEAPSEFKSL